MSDSLKKRILPGIVVAVLVFVGMFLRLWHLNAIPVSYYHDEIDYVFTGQSVAQLGTDITGSWTPWQLRPLHTYNYTAELPAAWQALVQLLFGVGYQHGHTVSALFGLATVTMTAGASWLAWRNKTVTMATVIILLLNPWHVFLSRMSYEVVISLLGQVMVVTSFIWLWQKPGKKWWIAALVGMLGFFHGYFTYHGAKLTLLVLSLVGVTLTWWPWPKRPNKKAVMGAGLVMLTVLALGLYSWLLTRQGLYGGRETEFIWRSTNLTQTVNTWYQHALHWPGQRWVVNKVTILAWEGVKRYLSVFDVYRLAVSGYESGWQFSLAVHGFWYLTSLVWLPIGIYEAWKKHRGLTQKLLVLLAVSPVATAISLSHQSIFRSAITYWLLLFFVGYGLATVWQRLQPWWARAALAGVILLQAVWFGAQYFGAYPITSSNNHYFEHELLAAYVGKATAPLEVYVEHDAFQYARSIVFYNNWLIKLDEPQRQQFADIDRQVFTLPGVTVSEGCPRQKSLSASHLIAPGLVDDCDFPGYWATAAAELTTVRSLSTTDSRALFYLLPDFTCEEYEVPEYIYAPRLELFNPLELSLDTFCRSWLKTEPLPKLQ